MERRKKMAIEAATLILGTILVSSISAKNVDIHSSDFMHEKGQTSLGQIEVEVKLLYGPADLPLVCYFKNVKINATNAFDMSHKYTGITDSNGKCTLTSIKPGLYRVKAERDGYVDISSLGKKYRLVQIDSGEIRQLEFTLTEQGGPFDEESVVKAKTVNLRNQRLLQRLNTLFPVLAILLGSQR